MTDGGTGIPHNGDSPEPCPACMREAPAATGGGELLVVAPTHASLIHRACSRVSAKVVIDFVKDVRRK